MARRIDDHSFWAGQSTDKSVLPEGCKTKSYSSVDGTGGVKSYEDTTEAIARNQEISKGKINSHPNRANYRN